MFQQTYRSATAIAERTLWRNLYQGVGTVALVAAPSSGTFFTTYEGVKYALAESGFLSTPAVHALSSSVAQLVNCAIVAPAEVLKQNAQVLAVQDPSTPRSSPPGQPKKNASSSSTIRVLQRLKRHPTQLWSGYTALVARDLPFTALQFPVFEYLKELLVARRSGLGKGSESMGVFERAWISAVSAGAAGSAAAWVTTPFDVVKTRMMLDAGSKDSNGAERVLGEAMPSECGHRKRSGFQVGREVLQQEGIRGLFRGEFVRAAFTILGNGMFIGCYEGAKTYLQKEDSQKSIDD